MARSHDRKKKPDPPWRPSKDNLVGAYDQSLRLLLHKRPYEFIAFGLNNPKVRVLRPIEGAVPALGRELDGGYLIRLGRTNTVAHLEFHRRHQSLLDLAQDVLEAQVRIFRREKVKVLSLVFDLFGRRRGPVWTDHVVHFGAPQLAKGGSRCVFRRVNLRVLPWQDLLKIQMPMLWSLVPLSEGGADLEAQLSARDAIEAADLPPSDQADNLAVLCFLAEAEAKDVAGPTIRRYILQEKLMRSTFYESIIKEGMAKGIEEGMAKGLEYGMAKGREQGMRQNIADLCEVLAIKLGPQRRAKLDAMNTDQLRALSTHLKTHRAWPK
jgi:hypothetical protein